MTPKERADDIMRRWWKGSEPLPDFASLPQEIEKAIIAAIEEDRKLAWTRFHANALLPTTWEWQAIEDAKEAGALDLLQDSE
jgi:hypothetical protein